MWLMNTYIKTRKSEQLRNVSKFGSELGKIKTLCLKKVKMIGR